MTALFEGFPWHEPPTDRRPRAFDTDGDDDTDSHVDVWGVKRGKEPFLAVPVFSVLNKVMDLR